MQSELINLILNIFVYSLIAITAIGSGFMFFINFSDEIKDIESQFSQFNKKGEKLFLETGIF